MSTEPIYRIIETKYDQGGMITLASGNMAVCNIKYETVDTEEYFKNLKTGENFKNRNFVIDDIVGLLGEDGIKTVKTIINILYIRTEKNFRNKHFATDLMKRFLDGYANSEDTIIVFRAACTEDDYPTEPTDKQYLEFFNHMMKFLVPFGFTSIQALSGFEFSEPYLYVSPTSKAAKLTWNKFVDWWYEEHTAIMDKFKGEDNGNE